MVVKKRLAGSNPVLSSILKGVCEMGRLYDELEVLKKMPKSSHRVRNLVISKLVEDDLMFQGAIEEIIQMLKKAK